MGTMAIMPSHYVSKDPIVADLAFQKAYGTTSKVEWAGLTTHSPLPEGREMVTGLWMRRRGSISKLRRSMRSC